METRVGTGSIFGTGERSSFTNAGTLIRTGEGTSTINYALETTLSGDVQVLQGNLYVNWDLVM